LLGATINDEDTMTQKPRSPAIDRRDALGLIAATVVADAALIGPLQAATLPAGPSVRGSPNAAGAPQLAGLTADHFEPLIGESFIVGDRAVTLRKVRRGHNSGPQFRQQFGIVFDAPRDLALQSEILPLTHPTLGRHDVLAGLVGAAGTARLEICFA
jgi:hypothetical protein